MTEAVRSSIRKYIIENFLFCDDGVFDNSQSLLQTGIVDSTGILELVTYIEETYGIAIADEEMLPENLDSVDRIASYVTRKKTIADNSVPIPETKAPILHSSSS